MTGDKILLCDSLGSDYNSYFVAKGFCDLLTRHRVRSWPYKHTHNNEKDVYPERCEPGGTGRVMTVVNGQIEYRPYKSGSELWTDPALFRAWKPGRFPGAQCANDGPLRFTEERPLGIPKVPDVEILRMCDAGEFGLIVLNGARWHGSAALSELQSLERQGKFSHPLPPIAFVDGEDYTQRRWDFCDAFKPAVYFKRSMLVGGHPCDFMLGQRPEQVVRPLPFAALWDIPWVPWDKRTRDVFCVFGATQVQRGRLREIVEEVCSQIPGVRYLAELGHPLKGEYMAELSRSKIVIDHQGSGTDTLRFWEASAAGACVISDLNLEMPEPALSPGYHYMQYPADTSFAANRQDFVRFRELLHRAITRDEETERMAQRCYNDARAHHSPLARAKYIIHEIRVLGHPLEGLPS